MDASETRLWTIAVGCFSLATILLFLVVYTPEAMSARPGASWRPMTPVPLIALLLAYGGWIPGLAIGLRQLFWRPRRYGCISIAIAFAQFAGFQCVEWLLMDSRGITWGS